MIKLLGLFVIITLIAFKTLHPTTMTNVGYVGIAAGALVLLAAVFIQASKEDQTNN